VIVTVSLHTPLTIQIETEDGDYLDQIKEHFTSYVQGFQYMNAWKAGNWDGKVCLIHKFNNTLPYGLLFDLVRIHKKNFPRNRLIIQPEVKSLFKGTNYQLSSLNLKPYPYQKDCISACFKYTKGIIRSATASGKSLVISYIVYTLLNKKKSKVNRALVVVPTKQLVEQFYKDMIVEYGIPENLIGRVYQKYKHWDKPITISTWQSISRNHDKLPNYEVVIMDECHGVKSVELKKILSKVTRAYYRLGFTGTLHSDELDNWNTKSYLGPVIREYPSGLLAEEGYISKCSVKMLNIEYQQDEWEGVYNDVKDEVFVNEYRNELLKMLVGEIDHNVLVLVGKVEKEGEFLYDQLSSIPDKEVVFLSGRDDVDLREEWRERCKKETNIVMIATYGIFTMGLNIPNLKYLILAAPFKSKIRVLQSIGRSLRKHSNKEKGAIVFDIVDQTKYFGKYGDIRVRYYDQEGFDVKDFVFEEGDSIDLKILL